MGIQRFFNKTLTQNRKTSGSGAKVEPWAFVATFRGCIFPISTSDPSIFSSEYIKLGITHGMYCGMGAALKAGDQIIDGTKEYIVKKEPDWVKFHDVLLSEVVL